MIYRTIARRARGLRCAALIAIAAAAPLYASAQDALAPILGARRAINVHEHIDGLPQAAVLVDAMDRHGIAKTVLMGSSRFTIALYEWTGFTRYDENNGVLLDILAKYPGRFEAWPTIDPRDPDHLEKFKSLHARGATGLKLYVGHGYRTRYTNRYMFHTVALDDPLLFPVYQYCTDHFLPVCMHVNSDMPGFAGEFAAVLTRFPDLKVVSPHWMLSSIRQSRLREYLEVFPNLYADIGFGHDDYLIDGLRRISRWRDAFQGVLADYPGRFFFGTDFVFTELRPKDDVWIATRINAYYDLLSKDAYTTPLIPGETLRGLALPPARLEDLLYRNYDRFSALKPAGTKLPRPIDWPRLAVPRVDRQPGQALPPPPAWSR